MNNNGCQLDGYYNIMLHSMLFIITFPTLLLKRYRGEYPRKYKVFLLDVMKQLCVFIVFTTTSWDLGIYRGYKLNDFCAKYFIISITDIIVMAFSILAHTITQNFVRDYPKFKFISGNYYSFDYKSERLLRNWFYQAFIWVSLSLCSKLLMAAILNILDLPLYFVASLVLLPFRQKKYLETWFILILFPALINLVVVWVTDDFLLDPMHHLHDEIHVHAERKDHSSHVSNPIHNENEKQLWEPLLNNKNLADEETKHNTSDSYQLNMLSRLDIDITDHHLKSDALPRKSAKSIAENPIRRLTKLHKCSKRK